MGLIFSRGKKQRNSKDILEELEQLISSLSEGKRRNAQYERSFVGYLLILSFFMYLVGLVVFYLYYLPSNWLEGLMYGGPLLLFPVIVYLVKKLLNIFFFHRTTQFNAKLRELHEEKRKTLNEVMEKETYKTARELLQKYDPSNPHLQTTPTRQPRRSSNQNGQEVRRRRPPPPTPHPSMLPQNIAMATPRPQPPPTPAVVANHNPQPVATPMSQPAPPVQATPQPSLQNIPPGMCLGAAPGPPTPCPIMPRDRSSMDKMVEYLVGDGPNNRYALICSECKSHNGMALRDEFEYLTFRCAYCYTLNKAKKKRPTLSEPEGAPHTEGDGVPRPRTPRSPSQTSEGNTENTE